MDALSGTDWTEWKRMRRHSFIAYVIAGIVVATDYSFMFTSLYLYLKDVIKTSKPDLFYGITLATNCASSTVFGPILARWVDKYRKMRLLTNIALVLQIIGAILYVIPSSVIFPLIGRFISGVGDPYTSVCSGEVIRIYNKKEGTSALWWLAASYSFGYMIGPVIVVFFKNVDFHVFGMHFNQLNVTGLFVAGLLVITLVISNFLLHDCSAIFDLKTYTEQVKKTVNSFDNTSWKYDADVITEVSCLLNSTQDKKIQRYSDEKNIKQPSGSFGEYDRVSGTSGYVSINGSSAVLNESPIPEAESDLEPVGLVLRVLFTSVDPLLMYISTFVFVYALFALDVILPLLTQIVLKWSLTSLSMLFLVNAAAYFIMIIISSKYCVTDRAIYNLSVLSITAVVLSFVIILLLTHFKHNLTACVILMVFFECFWALGWMVEEVLIQCTLAKMVPSRCQNFTEALRNGASRMSMIFAAVTVPLALPYLTTWCIIIIAVTIILLFVFQLRRRFLSLIREITLK